MDAPCLQDGSGHDGTVTARAEHAEFAILWEFSGVVIEAAQRRLPIQADQGAGLKQGQFIVE